MEKKKKKIKSFFLLKEKSMHTLNNKWQNTTSANLISHSTHERRLIELIAAINSKQICWVVHAHIIWPDSFSCHYLWESCHATLFFFFFLSPLNLSGLGHLHVCVFNVDRAINKIYVNRSLIVLQQRFDKAEGEETCQRYEIRGYSQQHRPQPNIWSPFQALTVPHNRSLLFIFETLVMSLLLLSPQDNSCCLCLASKRQAHPHHHHHHHHP